MIPRLFRIYFLQIRELKNDDFDENCIIFSLLFKSFSSYRLSSLNVPSLLQANLAGKRGEKLIEERRYLPEINQNCPYFLNFRRIFRE